MLVLRVKYDAMRDGGGTRKYFNEAALAHNPNKLSDN